jgi:hypothetical protein
VAVPLDIGHGTIAPKRIFVPRAQPSSATKSFSELTMVSAVSGASKDELRKLSEFSYPA